MIDINKKYQTRDGRPVRILCTDRPDVGNSVVGLINERVCTWTKDGKAWDPCKDLVEVKEKVKVLVKRWVRLHGSTKNPLQSTYCDEVSAQEDTKRYGGVVVPIEVDVEVDSWE